MNQDVPEWGSLYSPYEAEIRSQTMRNWQAQLHEVRYLLQVIDSLRSEVYRLRDCLEVGHPSFALKKAKYPPAKIDETLKPASKLLEVLKDG